VLNKTQTRSLKALAAAGLSLAFLSPAFAGKTLDAIKQRGQVVCGVNTGLAGFSAADSSGNWTGLDVDVCKAVAAATLGDASKVKYVPLNAQQRFTANAAHQFLLTGKPSALRAARRTFLKEHGHLLVR
jgi:general L-amino acid transport system substrate-binding protein